MNDLPLSIRLLINQILDEPEESNLRRFLALDLLYKCESEEFLKIIKNHILPNLKFKVLFITEIFKLNDYLYPNNTDLLKNLFRNIDFFLEQIGLGNENLLVAQIKKYGLKLEKRNIEWILEHIPESLNNLRTNLIKKNEDKNSVEKIEGSELIDKLKSISPGREGFNKYEKIILEILEFLFEGKLKKFEPQTPMQGRTLRIDVTATNVAEKGFFYHLGKEKEIHCPYIMFECKNNNIKLKNVDYAQLGDRLSGSQGNFGMLIYRKHYEKTLKPFIDFYNRHAQKQIIIPLVDKDIINLINHKQNMQEEKIDDYLDNIFKKIIFQTE